MTRMKKKKKKKKKVVKYLSSCGTTTSYIYQILENLKKYERFS